MHINHSLLITRGTTFVHQWLLIHGHDSSSENLVVAFHFKALVGERHSQVVSLSNLGILHTGTV